MLQSTLVAGGNDTIMYINESRAAGDGLNDRISACCNKGCFRASFAMLVGLTIAFSVPCNHDCYRASLAMHTDAASLSNLATLLQGMCLRASAQLWMDRVHARSKKRFIAVHNHDHTWANP